MEENKEIYNLYNAAQKLDLSYAQLYKLVVSGQLKTVRIGTRYYVPRENLLAFLQQIGV